MSRYINASKHAFHVRSWTKKWSSCLREEDETIFKHYSVFIGSCWRLNHFMPRGMIRALKHHRINPEEDSVLRTIENIPSKKSWVLGYGLCMNHFLAQLHTWNACRQAKHRISDVCCSKSMRKTMIQVSEVLLFVQLNSAIYCLNPAFPQPYSCTKSDYFNHL